MHPKWKRFTDACQAVVDAKDNPAVNYAVGYARAGLTMDDWWVCKTQCLYILSNITAWRGDTAKHVRAELKELSTME